MTDLSPFFKDNKVKGTVIKMDINGKSVSVEPYLSLEDLMLASKLKGKIESKRIFEQILIHHVLDFEEKECLKNANELLLKKDQLIEFLSIFIKSDDKLFLKYSNFSNNSEFNEEFFNNFISSIVELENVRIENIEKKFNLQTKTLVSPIVEPRIIAQAQSIASSFAPLFNKNEPSLLILQKFYNDLGCFKIFDTCSNLLSSFSKVSSWYSNLFKNFDFSIENFDRLQPVITSIGNDYLKLYSSVTSFTLKCDRAKKWGNFGWSVLCDDINLAEIDNSAFNEESADDCVLRLISPDYLNCLKNKTLAQAIDIFCKNDIEEAYSDFKYHRYKSCALLIFSIIEGISIKKQIPSQKNHPKQVEKRKTGYSGVDLVIYVAGEILSAKWYPRLLNLQEVMKLFFSQGKDFNVQPSQINRHFLAHGMLLRDVTRADCLKLFFLVYHYMCFSKDVPELDTETRLKIIEKLKNPRDLK